MQRRKHFLRCLGAMVRCERSLMLHAHVLGDSHPYADKHANQSQVVPQLNMVAVHG